jgi:hypothetical protein
MCAASQNCPDTVTLYPEGHITALWRYECGRVIMRKESENLSKKAVVAYFMILIPTVLKMVCFWTEVRIRYRPEYEAGVPTTRRHIVISKVRFLVSYIVNVF